MDPNYQFDSSNSMKDEISIDTVDKGPIPSATNSTIDSGEDFMQTSYSIESMESDAICSEFNKELKELEMELKKLEKEDEMWAAIQSLGENKDYRGLLTIIESNGKYM